ncbi:MAG TPA: TonB family protein [Terracidiphilus sp.]|nr:TonB family protein [Terracidiphilus sp.]
MRRILIASVLFSPLFFCAAVTATPLAVDDVVSSTTRPISTGVKPARILSSTNIDLSSSTEDAIPYNAEVVLTLNVDKNGQPQDVQVVQSESPFLNEPVAAAVRQFRFRPAMLNHIPVATDMTLTVVVQH